MGKFNVDTPSAPNAQERGAGAGWRLLPVKHVDAEGVMRPGITNEMVDAFWVAWKVAENKGRGHYESTYAAWNAAADATPAQTEAMPGREEIVRTVEWLTALQDANLDEVCADGGVTVGQVFQQEARTVVIPRILALLSSAKES